MNGYPSVYVDIAPFNWAIPAPVFTSYLKRLIDYGWERRILYGVKRRANGTPYRR